MIYVLRWLPVIEEVVAKSEEEARQIASYYHDCLPGEWELTDVRGSLNDQDRATKA